ncbi:hypothetical protein CPLU01_07502 [Colletotrichum plurivorum]|uniref:Uncharacterized protein n=1 Tax=Colletotrichum plurivorum TaxID=2175906 RepID=A0A8H6NES7_9PEZI|nr:hypothetical protein CPLU01_07502 [Colletotrichum plurivorum]
MRCGVKQSNSNSNSSSSSSSSSSRRGVGLQPLYGYHGYPKSKSAGYTIGVRACVEATKSHDATQSAATSRYQRATSRESRQRQRESRRQRRGGGGDGGGGRGGDGDRPFACKGSPSPSTPPATTPAIQLVSDGRWWPTAVVVPVPAYLTVTPPPRISSQHHHHHHQSTTTTSPNPARGLATSALWAGFHPHSGWPKPPPGPTPGLVPVGRRPGSKLTVRVRVAQPLRGKKENRDRGTLHYRTGSRSSALSPLAQVPWVLIKIAGKPPGVWDPARVPVAKDPEGFDDQKGRKKTKKQYHYGIAQSTASTDYTILV